MSRLEQIEQLVRDLEPGELAEFASWFESYQHQQWDRSLDRDANESDRLNALADAALAEHRAGRTRPL